MIGTRRTSVKLRLLQEERKQANACTVKWIWESMQSGVCDWDGNGFVKRTRYSAQLFWGSACNVMIHWREGKRGDVD